jgi:hypothetical protein
VGYRYSSYNHTIPPRQCPNINPLNRHLLPKPRAPRYPPSKPPSPQITYNLKLLLHDPLNLKTSPAAAARLDRTTDPLYISTPYFTDEEAEIVKGSLVEMAYNLPEGNENGVVCTKVTMQRLVVATKVVLAKTIALLRRDTRE